LANSLLPYAIKRDRQAVDRAAAPTRCLDGTARAKRSSWLVWLRQIPEAKPAAMLGLIERLNHVRAVGIDPEDLIPSSPRKLNDNSNIRRNLDSQRPCKSKTQC
jgi:hypothetical protein